MEEKTVKQVSKACAELYRAGLAALEREEPGSAIPDFLLALELEPGFVECRQALRRAAQIMPRQELGFFRNFVHQLRSSPSLSEAQFLVHFKPLKAISLAERVLTNYPSNLAAHRVMAEAALMVGFIHTALLSLESLPTSEHRTIELELAAVLNKSAKTSGAAVVCGRLLKENPEDRTALRALRHYSKRAVASQSAAQKRSVPVSHS